MSKLSDALTLSNRGVIITHLTRRGSIYIPRWVRSPLVTHEYVVDVPGAPAKLKIAIESDLTRDTPRFSDYIYIPIDVVRPLFLGAEKSTMRLRLLNDNRGGNSARAWSCELTLPQQ